MTTETPTKKVQRILDLRILYLGSTEAHAKTIIITEVERLIMDLNTEEEEELILTLNILQDSQMESLISHLRDPNQDNDSDEFLTDEGIIVKPTKATGH